MKRKSVKFAIGPATFENPVFLASGPAGYGTEYAGLIELDRIGAVVTKTITYEPREGNRGRRLWETSAGLLNSIGLENVGARAFFADKLPALLDAGATPVVSLGAEDWDDYMRLLDVAAGSKAEAFELNLSCPNVERGGMVVGTNPELLAAYVRRARETLAGRVVLAKLTPNVSDIEVLAAAAEQEGADGITAINTVVGADLCPGLEEPVFRRVKAGLSGPAILPVALDAVWRISRAVRIPVLGAGGIHTVEDALKFFASGASAVQIGTAIFYDPDLPGRIVEALARRGIPRAVGAGDPLKE
ncbi:MAG: dihydroorotate dehydrogenase [Candidatus Krumholzibacteriaceae bacterium]